MPARAIEMEMEKRENASSRAHLLPGSLGAAKRLLRAMKRRAETAGHRTSVDVMAGSTNRRYRSSEPVPLENQVNPSRLKTA